MKFIGIIPARYASSRFPGKPLVDIKGKSMIQRVYEQATQSMLDEVIVATDDDRIFDHVKTFGGKVLMTAEHHGSGTERCREAADQSDGDVIINIQGDEPFINPEQINLLAKCFEDKLLPSNWQDHKNNNAYIATLIKKVSGPAEISDPHTVKAVIDASGKALYFSRAPIPWLRKTATDWTEHHTYYKHIGIYGYYREVLDVITELAPSSLEQSESLEQLRWLENGYAIQTAETHHDVVSIDTPEDLEKVLF